MNDQKHIPERLSGALYALYEAFHEGKLIAGSCSQCAVGNIVSSAYKKQNIDPNTFITLRHPYSSKIMLTLASAWSSLFITSECGQEIFSPSEIIDRSDVESYRQVMETLKMTGYNRNELSYVEWLFESHTKIKMGKQHVHTPEEIMADQYEGLQAVTKFLCKLDNVDEIEALLQLFGTEEDGTRKVNVEEAKEILEIA
jgi:hypothetical protein